LAKKGNKKADIELANLEQIEIQAK